MHRIWFHNHGKTLAMPANNCMNTMIQGGVDYIHYIYTYQIYIQITTKVLLLCGMDKIVYLSINSFI